MECHSVGNLEIVFDHSGRDDWGKFSFPVWYGIPVKVKWQSYRFDFNLRGSLKRISGGREVWPDQQEILKRTDGNDLIYYSAADGYDSSYDLIKNYYIPFNGISDCDLLQVNPLCGNHVKEALETFDTLVKEAGNLASETLQDRPKDFLTMLSGRGRNELKNEGARLHGIIGGMMPVLPPDTIDVDYEVIPLFLSEGCDYNCRFCYFKTSGTYRRRSWKEITYQIRALEKFYGKDLLNYNSLVLGQNNALAAGESCITGAAELAYEVLRLGASYHRGRPQMFLFGSVDAFLDCRDSLFDKMECLPYHSTINIGLESSDQRTLEMLGKPLAAERVKAAFQKMQAVNQAYANLTVSCNFVIGTDLPCEHLTGIQNILSGASPSQGKGVIYLSPLLGGSKRRQILRDFREIKIYSPLPVYLYLAQRL